MTTIGVFGAAGRMGHAIAHIIGETPGCEAGPAIDKGDDPAVFTADTRRTFRRHGSAVL